MQISLEHIKDSSVPNTFRVAFHSAESRCLLPYPSVTGLRFVNGLGNLYEGWQAQQLISAPLDDFVLNPGDRISFDLYANINQVRADHRWTIWLPRGDYIVQFDYQVERETEWYDFLAKRSRFAAITPIWRGHVDSNAIRFSVISDRPDEYA